MAKGGKLKKFVRERRFRIKIKTWMLFLVLVPLLFLDATLLRQDHIRMTELRDNVINVDAEIEGAETDDELEAVNARLAEALTELKEFVFSNIVINIVEENGTYNVMFGTGPFYLEQSYVKAASRALSEAESQLTDDSNPNGNIYEKASFVCRPQAIQNGWSWNSSQYINCMMGEIQKYPSANEIQDTVIANLPSTELYRRNYASPVFAPTLTGFMLLLTAIIIVIIVMRIIGFLVLRIAVLFL